MKITLLILIGFYRIISSNGRLRQKSSKATTEIITARPVPPIRLTREVFGEDSLTGFSIEDNAQNDEFIRSHNKKARYFFRIKSPSKSLAGSVARLPRESSEIVKFAKNHTDPDNAVKKVTLLKKPIPKFNDVDYDDDFQVKVNKIPINVAESGEHEDEDFNLDDYDFDVNHDEFIGRGKPLEPRMKYKESVELVEQQQPKTGAENKLKSSPTSDVKVQSNVIVPPMHEVPSTKKERAALVEVTKKTAHKVKEDDYYYDVSKNVPKETKLQEPEDEFAEENDESKELERKGTSVRTARSPWYIHPYIDKLGEKTSVIMSRILSFLPMFPQVPFNNELDGMSLSNEPMTDSLNGRPFKF